MVEKRRPYKLDRHIAALNDPDFTTRREAALKLGALGRREAVAPLCHALADPHWNVRRNAAKALGQIGDPAAMDALILALRDRSAGVRRRAATALGKLGDAQAIEPLCRLLSDKEPLVVEAVLEALVAFDSASVVPLCLRLSDKKSRVQHRANEALSRLVCINLDPTLYAVMEEPTFTPQERTGYVELLLAHARNNRSPLGKLRAHFVLSVISDIGLYCDHVLQSKADDAVKAGAKTILDYLTLGRASHADAGREKEILLRAATDGNVTDTGDVLLRASVREEGETSLAVPAPSLLDRFRQIFRRK